LCLESLQISGIWPFKYLWYRINKTVLQAKYAKLRRKKKQLQDVTKPKQEPEKNILKRPAEAKDAKEVQQLIWAS
jgi:hypothetical protein